MKIDEQSIHKLLKYGWPDRVIANYLDIEQEIISKYRKKYGMVAMNEYGGFSNKSITGKLDRFTTIKIH